MGVTAHRDLVPGEIPGIQERLQSFFNSLRQAFPALPLRLMTPLAEGGDQLAAEVAYSMDIPVTAVLPMPQDVYEEDFEPGQPLERFRALLSRADEIIELPPVQDQAPPASSQAGRDLQYAQLGVFISEHSQILLAIWDGKQGPHLGGTGQVVHYHLTAVMPGFEGDPTPAGLLADNENDLVFHIVCSRDRPGGDVAEGLHPLQARWFSSRNNAEPSADIPADYHMLLSRLERFVLDWKEKADLIPTTSSSLLGHCPDLVKPAGATMTDTLFQAADALAIHYQRRVHSGLRALHIMAILAGFVFLVYTEYDAPSYVVLVFLGLFFAGVGLHMVGGKREWHRKYLDYRALAEGLRVQLYWNLSGVVDRGWAGFAYDNFLQKQDVDLGWIRHVMRQASMQRQRGQDPDPGWVSWVIEEWVGQPKGSKGQLAYYSYKEAVNSSRYRRTRILGSLTLWLGISIAVLLFLVGDSVSEEQQRSLLVLMGALPLVAGVWDAYSHKKAEKELIKQYGFMGRVFGKARLLLEENEELAFRRKVLMALGQAALDEGAEWLLMHRERPLEHGGL